MKVKCKLISLSATAMFILAGCSQDQQHNGECPPPRENANRVEIEAQLEDRQFHRLRRQAGGIGTVILVDKATPAPSLSRRIVFPCTCLQSTWNEPEHCIISACDATAESQTFCINLDICEHTYVRLEDEGLALYTAAPCNFIGTDHSDQPQ